MAKAKRANALLSKAGATGLHCLVHAGLAWFWLWPWDENTRLYAALYIFAMHFVIDFTRTMLETSIFDTTEVKIFRRQDVIRWLVGRDNGATEVHAFMERNIMRWLLLNIADQSLHLLSISVFVLYIYLR